MTDLNHVRDRYLQAWNEPDDNARLALLRQGWTPDASYADPMMSGEGHQGLCDMIGTARISFPGHTFSPRGDVDGYGQTVRFSWNLAAGAAPVAKGTDVVQLDATGRITQVIGFLDPA
ncbi:MAG: polyketide cyclase [Alphaproteobacteria bacterium]|nr:polyketide cyclase [Alphaproteobacteria bacterium]